MPLDVFRQTLLARGRSLAWWSAGLVGATALIVAVYPTVRDNPDLNELVESYPEALKAFIAFGGELDYLSAAGYLGSELFSFIVPLLLLIAAIGGGSRAIAGEEEAGTLELLLANPVSRGRVALEKLAALTVELSILALVLWLALLVEAEVVGMEIGAANLLAAAVSAALLALVYGAGALLVGAATGRRSLAIGLAAAAAVAAYLVNSLAELVGFLEPIRLATPFYHYAASDPLRHGLGLDHAGLLLAVCALAAALAPPALGRRDLR